MIKERIYSFLFNHSKKSLSLLILFLALLSIGLTKVQLNFGVKIWFKKNDPLVKDFDRFIDTFGTDNYVFLSLTPPKGKNIFSLEVLNQIRNLTEDLGLVKQVLRVDSLDNFVDIVYDNDEAQAITFIKDNIDYDTIELKRLKERAISHPLLQGKYISKRARDTLFLIKLDKPAKNQITYENVLSKISQLIKPYEKKGYSFQTIGTAKVVDEFKNICFDDLVLIIPILLLLVGIFIYVFIGHPFAILLTFLIIGATNYTVLSLSGFLGIELNNLSSMVPGVLMAICIADAIHFLSAFYNYSGKPLDSARYSFNKNLMGTFLTTFTTSIGFLSLTNSELVPIADFGLLCAIGTLCAWLYSLLLIFPLIVLFPLKSKNLRNKGEKTLKWTNFFPFLKLSQFSIKHANLIIIFFFGLGLSSLALTLKNEVNSSPFEYFNPKLKIYKDNQYLLKSYGGFSSFEISIDTKKNDGAYDVDFLRKVNKLEQWIREVQGASYVNSIADYSLMLNQVFNQNRKEFYSIPKTSDKSAQFLLFYQFNLPPGQDLNEILTSSARSIRISVFWDTQNSDQFNKKTDEIKKKANDLGLNVTVTGREYLYNQMNNYVVDSYVFSIGITILAISVLLCFFFKSIKLGLLSLFPNLFPILFGSGFMYLVKNPIDVGTVLVASVCFGIAVDDTIHFLLDTKRKLSMGLGYVEAFEKVYRDTGVALISTTLILVLSFSTFLLADFIPNRNFGLFSALILLTALLTDLFLLPAMVSKMKIQRNK